ncbi:hypothetical protein QBC42DRAFT_344661 [Cladorrhinum samala]|uniref:Uncharacterized protein n=1 Tax=Cladorrhinum samala TaxID=585594 RepID=A0AAV9HZB7_9PEZI|nr:hypothetical protein QBC42DRAFT_344661 [Cladorrhinum samala]
MVEKVYPFSTPPVIRLSTMNISQTAGNVDSLGTSTPGITTEATIAIIALFISLPSALAVLVHWCRQCRLRRNHSERLRALDGLEAFLSFSRPADVMFQRKWGSMPTLYRMGEVLGLL